MHRPGLEDTPGLGLAATRDSLDTEAAAAVAPHLVCSDPAPAPARSSELASILQRGPGQYILEKRQETEIRSSVCELEEAFRSPSSIKQSVIVQPPSTSCLDSASTSHQSPAARQPRKRKLPPQNVVAESQNPQNSHNPQNPQNSTAGFSQLAALVPGLAEGGSIKVSKAAQLMKAADHIRGLKTENQNLEEEIELLQASNQDLLDNILSFQTQLANNGKSRNTILYLPCVLSISVSLPRLPGPAQLRHPGGHVQPPRAGELAAQLEVLGVRSAAAAPGHQLREVGAQCTYCNRVSS